MLMLVNYEAVVGCLAAKGEFLLRTREPGLEDRKLGRGQGGESNELNLTWGRAAGGGEQSKGARQGPPLVGGTSGTITSVEITGLSLSIKTLSSRAPNCHYSFSRSKYFHLLIAPNEGFITLIR